MKALEVTRTIDEKDRLILDRPLTLDNPGPVGIILLLPEPTDEAEDDPDDTPVAEVKASLKRSLSSLKQDSEYLFLKCGSASIDFRF